MTPPPRPQPARRAFSRTLDRGVRALSYIYGRGRILWSFQILQWPAARVFARATDVARRRFRSSWLRHSAAV